MQSESNEKLLTMWSELKALVESLEFDAQKNANGVSAAGVRFRKGLRDLRERAYVLVKTTIQLDKAKKTK